MAYADTPLRVRTLALSARMNAQGAGSRLSRHGIAFGLGLLVTAGIFFLHSESLRILERTAHIARLVHAVPRATTPVRAAAAHPPKPTAYDIELGMSEHDLLHRWDTDIARAAKRFHVPDKWIRAVMEAESGGRTMSGENQPITSSAGAMGLMQVMPKTWQILRAELGLGENPYDPHDNIVAGAAYLKELYARYGYPTMFAAYNDGPGNLEQRLAHGHMLPLETQLYVGKITGLEVALAGVGRGSGVGRFTRPNGTSITVRGRAVSAVLKPLPDEYAPSVHAVIVMGKRTQGVREDVTTVEARLHMRHLARVEHTYRG